MPMNRMTRRTRYSVFPQVRRLAERIWRFFRREPDDPYALVGARKKPRPPHRHGAVAEPLD
jgi:hypothetical protein